MSYNKVKELNKYTFHGLQGLIRLQMDHNNIEFINPEAFYGLTSLKLVHLEGNAIRQLHPDTFVTLRYIQIFKTSSIKNIYLSDNALSSLPPEIFSYAPDLESIYLHGNPWACHCNMEWFVKWVEEKPGLLKCKRDRSYASGFQCPICETPVASKGKDMSRLPLSALACFKPEIDPHLKQKNISLDEGDFTPVSSNDFIAPIGSMVLNMTDQSENDASVVCSVQRPRALKGVSVDEKDDVIFLSASFSTYLVCNIDYEHIQQLWRILAMYSDLPMTLSRGLMLTKTPYISYKYQQKEDDEEATFSGIEAEVKADPIWLMQGQFTLQLDRTTTTFSTLHIKYASDIQMNIENKPHKYTWAMIKKDNTTKTEHSVLIGGTAELDCQAFGEPKPAIEWIMPDGSKVRAPYSSEDRRIIITTSGRFKLKAADSSETGLYRCIATNYLDADVLAFRITVLNPDVEEIDVNGAQMSRALGESLFLPCGSVGIPEASINWILPDHTVLDKMGNRIHVHLNGTLVIDSVSEKDAGDYLCVARNKIGDDLLLMKATVAMKPAKIEYKQFIKKQVPYGDDLKVDCRASGAPEPEITWGLPDGTMVNSVLQADDSGTRRRRYVLFHNGTLYLNKVGVAEEGDYTCYAENTLGKDEMKVHVTIVTAAPRIRTTAHTFAKVEAGAKVMFNCEAVGEPKPKIMWLLPSNNMIAASNDRHLMHVNGSLAIRNLKVTDSGEYLCVARNTAGDDTKVFKLEVDANPPIINGLYRNKTIIKDSAVKHTKKLIDCKAEGTPTPQVMWIIPDNIFLTAPYYGSRIIVHRNGTLEIRNVRVTDTAEFVCVARNEGGETVMVVQLEITNMLRRPMFKNPFNEKVMARTGKTTILNCSADGYPPPEMIWLLPNGTRFTNSQKITKYQLGRDGTLIIYNPSKSDVGKYRCGARNKVGYIEKLIVLEVGQKPYILTQPKGLIRSISGQTLFLHCLSEGSPKPKVSWTVPGGYMLSRPQINGKYILLENGTLVIQEAGVHDRGNYICKAHNDGGEATMTVPVIIIGYPPRITSGPPQSMRTRAGAAVHLNCVAIGIPKPEITWELPDHSVLSTTGKGRPAGSELLHPQGTLVIQKPSVSDSGTYKCLAKNHFGTDSKITYIQVVY
ncbi:UNVERIFIED_CONTAM: hypothetical protein FKN15_004542 [Acipenser sinensis]